MDDTNGGPPARRGTEGVPLPPTFRRPGTNDPAEYSLMMVTGKPGTYRLLNQFEFVEPPYSAKPGRTFEVPVDEKGMVTDFASIPFFATWLVPKDGKHTPAAFLHDAQVKDDERERTVKGPYVERHEADRVFRLAMQELGVPAIRRALMWAAVNLATLAKLGSWRRKGFWAFVIAITLVASLVFNLVWVNRVFDGSLEWARDWPILSWGVDFLERGARWVGGRLDFLPDSGLVLALVAVVAVLVLWGRRVEAGMLTAGAVALFGYPLLVAAWSFLVYWSLEKLLEWIMRGLRRAHSSWPRGPINVPGILRTKPLQLR